MKIGIITIHNSPNYGASLQSFALYKYLEQCGYDVEIIDLHRPFHNDFVHSKKYKPYKHRFETCQHRIYRVLGDFAKKIKRRETSITKPSEKNKNLNSEFIEKFNSFNSQIKLSQPFLSVGALYKNPPIYDVYITGSDQVWNPEQPWCLEPYFLTFVKKGKCISYASSIGTDLLTKKETKDFSKWLKHYNAISVRERQHQILLNKITGSYVYRVADPTILLDVNYWDAISIKPDLSNYILLFSLELDSQLMDYAVKLSQQSEKKLVVLHPRSIICKEYISVNNAGPEEFLGYISKADIVITDSFHCTLFSILLGARNFYTYIAKENKRGTRIIDLLTTFSLENHLLDSRLSQSMTNLEENVIDRSEILNVILTEQRNSRSFLADNL